MNNNTNNLTTGGRIRRRDRGFAQVSNCVLRDTTLSLKAKGLYALIESYLNIPDWDLYKGQLMGQCIEKRDGFNSAWNELKKHGYLVQFKIRDKQTGKWIYEYELRDYIDTVEVVQIEETTGLAEDKPSMDSPEVDFPQVDFPHLVNPPLYKDLNNNTKKINNNTTNKSSSSNNTKVIDKDQKKIDDDENKKSINIVLDEIKQVGHNTTPTALKSLISKHTLEIILEAVDRTRGIDIKSSYIGYLRKVIDTVETEKSNRANTKSYSKSKSNYTTEPTPQSFNNFEPRPYDYAKLERQLLGWE